MVSVGSSGGAFNDLISSHPIAHTFSLVLLLPNNLLFKIWKLYASLHCTLCLVIHTHARIHTLTHKQSATHNHSLLYVIYGARIHTESGHKLVWFYCKTAHLGYCNCLIFKTNFNIESCNILQIENPSILCFIIQHWWSYIVLTVTIIYTYI